MYLKTHDCYSLKKGWFTFSHFTWRQCCKCIRPHTGSHSKELALAFLCNTYPRHFKISELTDHLSAYHLWWKGVSRKVFLHFICLSNLLKPMWYNMKSMSGNVYEWHLIIVHSSAEPLTFHLKWKLSNIKYLLKRNYSP